MSIAAEKVAEVLAPDAETQWHGVIDRRSREIDEDKVSCRPVEQVVQDIRAKLNARRQPS